MVAVGVNATLVHFVRMGKASCIGVRTSRRSCNPFCSSFNGL